MISFADSDVSKAAFIQRYQACHHRLHGYSDRRRIDTQPRLYALAGWRSDVDPFSFAVSDVS